MVSIYNQILSAYESIRDKTGEEVTLTKTTEVPDVNGVITSTSDVSDTGVKVIIAPITEEERKFISGGVSAVGLMKCYANPSYDLINNGDGTTIEVGDKITRGSAFGSAAYRVESIIGRHPVEGQEVCRTLILRRIAA